MKCEGSQGYRTAATSKHRSLMQCTVCRHQTSPTFKTALDRSRWPRCAWFLAVYLFRLAKTGLSSLTQMRQHAFGDRTARMLQQTTRRAMNSKDVSHRPFLSGTGPT